MSRWVGLVVVMSLFGCRSHASASNTSGSEGRLAFAHDGHVVATWTLADMRRFAAEDTVSAFDPYYQRAKRYRAIALESLLAHAFPDATIAQEQFVLRARDGYTVPIEGRVLAEGGAYVAIADADVPGWEPIGPQHANPGPFYFIWGRPGQQDLETHPRPWQLATIEIASFGSVFPHTVPIGVAEDTPERRGFDLFRRECIRCHAINREGGHVGPELNVPQSIVEYRPIAQIRAYVRNPGTFRYSNMPAHPTFTEGDLDALVAYFRIMSTRKFDPSLPTADGGRP